MNTHLDWMSKIDFSWFAEDENGHLATFSYDTDSFLSYVPDIVKSQYTEVAYNQLMEVVLDVLPVISVPRVIRAKHNAWDSSRGLYEYIYSEEKRGFELASAPQTTISSEQLRHHNFRSFDSLVLRMATLEYISTHHIDLVRVNRLLACR